MGLDEFNSLLGPHMFHPNKSYVVEIEIDTETHRLSKLTSFYLLAMDDFDLAQNALCWDIEISKKQTEQGNLSALNFQQNIQVNGLDSTNFLYVLKDRLSTILSRIFLVDDDDPNYF